MVFACCAFCTLHLIFLPNDKQKCRNFEAKRWKAVAFPNSKRLKRTLGGEGLQEVYYSFVFFFPCASGAISINYIVITKESFKRFVISAVNDIFERFMRGNNYWKGEKLCGRLGYAKCILLNAYSYLTI